MFKKNFFKICISLVAFLLFLTTVKALCCVDDCYPDANVCCADGKGYVGCPALVSGSTQYFCPDDVFDAATDDCLVCQCSDINTCWWYEDDDLCVGEDMGCIAIPDVILPEDSICEMVPCSLTSASWSTNLAYEGETVQLNLDASHCNNKQADFTVWEYDPIGGDELANLQPPSVSVTNDQATTDWTAEYASDWFGTDPEYYFIAKVKSLSIRSELLSVQKAQEFCGNGRVDLCETCDGDDPNNWGEIETCEDLGFDPGGTLKCFAPDTPNECHFDTSECNCDTSTCVGVANGEPGDAFLNIGEECDGPEGSWNGGKIKGCEYLDYFTGGDLDCNYETGFFDTCGCSKEESDCGNNVINLGEECDGTDWGLIEDCTDLDVFTGGNLKCNEPGTFDECFFNTSDCIDSYGICGDAVVNIGETCDNGDWGPVKDCTYFGFETGTLDCYAPGEDHECHFDTTGCSRKKPECGNDLREGTEECDGFDDAACQGQCIPAGQPYECTCPECAIYWDCSQTSWGECIPDPENPEIGTRTRIGTCQLLVDPAEIPSYCQIYEPPNEKLCIPEKEFPFFTNFNIILVILILTAYYIYREIKK